MDADLNKTLVSTLKNLNPESLNIVIQHILRFEGVESGRLKVFDSFTEL